MISKEDLLKKWKEIDKVYEERIQEYLEATERTIDACLKIKRLEVLIKREIEKYREPDILLPRERLQELLDKYEFLSFVIDVVEKDGNEYYKITARMKE